MKCQTSRSSPPVAWSDWREPRNNTAQILTEISRIEVQRLAAALGHCPLLKEVNFEIHCQKVPETQTV
jgi:hypothetical protein